MRMSQRKTRAESVERGRVRRASRRRHTRRRGEERTAREEAESADEKGERSGRRLGRTHLGRKTGTGRALTYHKYLPTGYLGTVD